MRLKEDIKLEARAVVLDIDTCENSATLLLKLAAQAEADIEAGLGVPQEEVFAQVEARLQRG